MRSKRCVSGGWGGRSSQSPRAANPYELLSQLTVDEILACLKRLRTSVKRWTKDGGRQGYLTFVDEFIV